MSIEIPHTTNNLIHGHDVTKHESLSIHRGWACNAKDRPEGC